MKPEILKSAQLASKKWSRGFMRQGFFSLISALLLAVTSLAGFAALPPMLTSPSNGALVSLGQDFTLAGKSFDDSVVRLDFYEEGSLIRTFSANAASFDWSNSVIGVHSYTVRAQDAQGVFTTSPAVNILVTTPNSQAVFFPEFTSSAGLSLAGRAAIVSNWLRLTPTTSGPKGGAFLPSKQPLTYGFETIFQFRITELIGGGADGIAFVIEGSPAPILGGAIGFNSVSNSLGVEYDTFQNANHGDPNDNHISVHSRGLLANTNYEFASLGWTTNIPNMSDGAVHTTKITYVPGHLTVFLDDLAKPAVTVNVGLDSYLNLDGGRGWVGLTACIGASQETHDILSWSFTAVTNPQPRIERIQPLDYGIIRLNFSTLPGYRYLLQSSADLTNWLDSDAEITGTGSSVVFEDEASPGATNRFYRVRVVP